MSAMKLEKNGRMSRGRNSRHIDIRYFIAKDRVASEGLDIVHCPTEPMLADFLTKPLQGSLFRKFKAVLLGHEHINTLQLPPPVTGQERVGTNISVKTDTVNGPITDDKTKSVTYADIVRR